MTEFIEIEIYQTGNDQETEDRYKEIAKFTLEHLSNGPNNEDIKKEIEENDLLKYLKIKIEEKKIKILLDRLVANGKREDDFLFEDNDEDDDMDIIDYLKKKIGESKAKLEAISK